MDFLTDLRESCLKPDLIVSRLRVKIEKNQIHEDLQDNESCPEEAVICFTEVKRKNDEKRERENTDRTRTLKTRITFNFTWWISRMKAGCSQSICSAAAQLLRARNQSFYENWKKGEGGRLWIVFE